MKKRNNKEGRKITLDMEFRINYFERDAKLKSKKVNIFVFPHGSIIRQSGCLNRAGKLPPIFLRAMKLISE